MSWIMTELYLGLSDVHDGSEEYLMMQSDLIPLPIYFYEEQGETQSFPDTTWHASFPLCRLNLIVLWPVETQGSLLYYQFEIEENIAFLYSC